MNQKKQDQTGAQTQSATAQEGAALLVLALPFVLAAASVWALWKITPLPAALLGAALIAMGAFYVVARDARNRLGIRIFLVIGAIVAVLITPLTFLSHTFPLKAMVGAVAACFAFALAVGLWRTLASWWKLFAALFAASLVAALIVPPPDGSFDPDDDKPIEVVLGVYDENVRPLPDAYALCTLAGEAAGRFVQETNGYEKTDEYGEAAFTFKAHTHWNAIICGAHKPPSDEEDGYALAMSAGPGDDIAGGFRRHVVLTQRVPRRNQSAP